MYNDPYENQPDPLDEFLAQLLSDIPDVLPAPITSPTSASIHSPASTAPFLSSSAAAAGTNIIPYYVPTSSQLTCGWLSPPDHRGVLICGAPLPPDPKHVCTHFRHVHYIRGNEKVMVQCHWHNCDVPPMQRGSLIRHVLTVHLGLLRWQCEVCRRMFSRRGTAHACAEGG